MERPWQPKDLFLVLLLRLPSAPERGPLQAIEMCSLPGLEAGSQVWAALVPSGDSKERSHPGPSPTRIRGVLGLWVHPSIFTWLLCLLLLCVL